MLNLLRILFPILLITCVVALSHVLNLFGANLRIAQLSGIITILGFLFYLYTGLRLSDADSMSKIRRFLLKRILGNTQALLVTCICLVGVLVVTIPLGIWSCNVLIIPNIDSAVQVYELEGKNENLLGEFSANKPFNKRFLSGKHRFKFKAEGFETVEKDVYLSAGLMSGEAHRIKINFRAEPDFQLKEFGQSSILLAGGLFYPEEYKGLPKEIIRIVLASSNPSHLWIENIYFNVFKVDSKKRSTFPYFGEGAGPPFLPKMEIVQGFVKLEPTPDLYPIIIPKISGIEVGKGLPPAKYDIITFVEPGYEYNIRVEIDWTELRDSKLRERFAFKNHHELDFPKIFDWQYLVKGSREVKILFYGIGLSGLVTHFQTLESRPSYTILVAPAEEHRRFMTFGMGRTDLEHVAWIQRPNDCPLVDMVGLIAPPGMDYLKRLKNFILIDGRVLLLQDNTNLYQAKVIEDRRRIAKIESAFDYVAKRSVPLKYIGRR